jgi:hypothetical protein
MSPRGSCCSPSRRASCYGWRMNVKALMLVAALVVPQVAHASDWVVVNAGEHKCIDAATTPWPSPYKMEQALRKVRTFKEAKIYRNADGTIRMVALESTDSPRVIVYMHDMAKCNLVMQQVLGSKGDLN